MIGAKLILPRNLYGETFYEPQYNYTIMNKDQP